MKIGLTIIILLGHCSLLICQDTINVEIKYQNVVQVEDRKQSKNIYEIRSESILFDLVDSIILDGTYNAAFEVWENSFDELSIQITSRDSMEIDFDMSDRKEDVYSLFDFLKEVNSKSQEYITKEIFTTTTGQEEVLVDTIQNVFIDSITITDFYYHDYKDFENDLVNSFSEYMKVDTIIGLRLEDFYDKENLNNYIFSHLISLCQYDKIILYSPSLAVSWKQSEQENWNRLIKRVSNYDPVWDYRNENLDKWYKIVSRRLDEFIKNIIPYIFIDRNRIDEFFKNKEVLSNMVIEELEKRINLSEIKEKH